MIGSRSASSWLSLLLSGSALLAGCDMVVLHPSGDVAAQQSHLIVVSTLLMLLIIVPVIALTLLFAWRYRESNIAARYTPEWGHSVQLELLIWAAPLLIIILLGALTWIGTHTLDPYRPLTRIDALRPLPGGAEPLVVEVVALDWKWLFIYPELGTASVNHLVVPVGTPISFELTSATVMNSFFVPQLGSQIYTMSGMTTHLQLQADYPGSYPGLSANFSGDGFADMRFTVEAVPADAFAQWVSTTRNTGPVLDATAYADLAKPSQAVAPVSFGSVAPGLFTDILSAGMSPGSHSHTH